MLLLGGTAQLGRAIATQALARDIEVTAVARGSGPVVAGTQLLRADRDQPDALALVRDRHWDVVIDLTDAPSQARAAVTQVRAEHWIFVSTISVYADPGLRGADESAEVLAPAAEDAQGSARDYGAAKVACEIAVREERGVDRSCIIRPGLIGGHEDVSDRSTYWPWRMAHPASGAVGGADSERVLVPDVPDQPTQLIDVRDLAAFVVHVARERISGTLDAVGERTSLGELLLIAEQVAQAPRKFVRADPQWLVGQGVNYWAGPRSLPLWLPEEMFGLMDRSGHAARTVGLTTRSAEDLFASALAYARARPADHEWRSGLRDAEERELLDLLVAESQAG